MQTDQHIWLTDDGRHVPDGHPDATLLAYAAGDPVPDEVLDELTGDTKQPKARRKPADKAKTRSADKAQAKDQSGDETGSGLTITRLSDDKAGDAGPDRDESSEADKG